MFSTAIVLKTKLENTLLDRRKFKGALSINFLLAF